MVFCWFLGSFLRCLQNKDSGIKKGGICFRCLSSRAFLLGLGKTWQVPSMQGCLKVLVEEEGQPFVGWPEHAYPLEAE